jgi:ABC-type multidrug transport system fused ATPase/permease subunit
VTSIFCLKLGTALKRLEISSKFLAIIIFLCYVGISARCSLLGHVNATAEGLPTIRSANAEQILIDEFDRHNDLYTSASYLYTCWFRALTFLLDIYFSLFTLLIILLFLINSHGIKSTASIEI